MTHIYLLIYPKLKSLKIGKADNVFNRACSMHRDWGDPDYANSFTLVISPELVFKLEKSLHLLLDQFALDYREGDGKTEFFSSTALSYAIEYIDVFVKSNKLPSILKKGVDIPKLQINKRIPINRGYIFTKHNNKKKKLISSLRYTIKNLETVLRVNNILIKYRARIKFELDFENKEYSLKLYDRKFLADVLFESMCFVDGSFSGGTVGCNLCFTLSKYKEYHKLDFHLNTSFDDRFILFVLEELRFSFKLLQKASMSSGQDHELYLDLKV